MEAPPRTRADPKPRVPARSLSPVLGRHVHEGALCGILRPVNSLEPPRPSRRLFWAVVGTTVGVFGIGALASLILRLPTETMMVDDRLLRTVLLECLLAGAWVPVLRRRGWSMNSATLGPEWLDLVRGCLVFAASYLVYWFAFTVLAVAVPSFQQAARSMQVGGAPSWVVVAAVAVVNPVAEEFLYLGFVGNVLKSDGIQLALAASVVARAIPHLYQGPTGLVSATVVGVVFGAYYLRSGRLWPVVLAHALADCLALGYLVGGAA